MKLLIVENAGNKKLKKAFRKLGDNKARREVMRVAASALHESTEYSRKYLKANSNKLPFLE